MSASNVLELEASMSVDTSEFIRGIKKAVEESEKLRKELGKTSTETNGLGKEVDREGKEAQDSADDNRKLGREVKTAGEHANSARSHFANLADLLKSGFAKAAKVGVGAISAASGGIGKVVKDSVGAYGEYEQLVGGIKATFADNQSAVDSILQAGANAWQTLQTSSNDYFQSFMSAYPLVKSGMEDQNEAIATTNRLLKLEADLANTFGYDASEAATAVNWALKGSYAYLDNLNIGIKGTKEGFLEAANASGVLGREIEDVSELTTDEIVSVLESYAAQYGVLNRTQQEGAATIQGSLKSTKAAWENLIVEMAKADGDVGGAFNILEQNVGAVAENMLPKVEQTLDGVGMLIEASAPDISKSITKLIPKLTPTLIRSAGSITGAIGQGLLQATPEVLDMGKNALKGIAEGIQSTDFSLDKSVAGQLLGAIFGNVDDYLMYGEQILAGIGNAIIHTDHGKMGKAVGGAIVSGLNAANNLLADLDMRQIGGNIADFMNNLPWKDIGKGMIDLLGSAIGSLGDIAIGFFQNMDGESFTSMIGVLAAPKILGGLFGTLKGPECSSTFTSIKELISTEVGSSGNAAGIGFSGAFMAGIKAFGLGYAIGSFLRDNIVIGGKTIGEWVDTGTEKLLGDTEEKAAKEWNVGNTITDEKGREIIIFDEKGNFTEAYNKYSARKSKENAEGWKNFDLEEYRRQNKLGIYADHNAIGNYVNTPRLSWVAENEPEYIIPESKMDKVYPRDNGTTYNVTINIQGTYDLTDPMQLHRAAELISNELQNMSVAQQRSMGGTAWQ